MTKSIISNDTVCYVCKNPMNIHRHHIYEGTGRRKLSEKYGCWVYLCARHHNMSNEGVHFNKELDLKLKRICQKKWENKYGPRDKFIRVFGRNYMYEEEI